MRKFGFLTFAAISLWTASAEAGLTGASLYRLCSSGKEDDKQICLTWTTAFADGIYSAQWLAETEHLIPATCLPEAISGTQSDSVIEKFLRNHPRALNQPADALAALALKDAFPCRKSN